MRRFCICPLPLPLPFPQGMFVVSGPYCPRCPRRCCFLIGPRAVSAQRDIRNFSWAGESLFRIFVMWSATFSMSVFWASITFCVCSLMLSSVAWVSQNRVERAVR